MERRAKGKVTTTVSIWCMLTRLPSFHHFAVEVFYTTEITFSEVPLSRRKKGKWTLLNKEIIRTIIPGFKTLLVSACKLTEEYYLA